MRLHDARKRAYNPGPLSRASVDRWAKAGILTRTIRGWGPTIKVRSLVTSQCPPGSGKLSVEGVVTLGPQRAGLTPVTWPLRPTR